MKIELADTFFKKLKGLMFRKSLDHALVFPLDGEKQSGASIHSCFMRFTFDVVYLDRNKKVVDFATIRPWSFYTPKKPANCFVELPEGMIKRKKIRIGSRLGFIPTSSF